MADSTSSEPSIDEQIDCISSHRRASKLALTIVNRTSVAKKLEREIIVWAAIEENLIAMRMQMKAAESTKNPASNFQHQAPY